MRGHGGARAFAGEGVSSVGGVGVRPDPDLDRGRDEGSWGGGERSGGRLGFGRRGLWGVGWAGLVAQRPARPKPNGGGGLLSLFG